MTIRSRLLLLLLPPTMTLIIFLSLFLYFDWSKESLFMLLLAVLFLLVTTVFTIAERISKPVRKLSLAALEIASGRYDTSIQVKGPREITELAHTLNTMRECLVEHMSRLKESALIRERMHGEYECSLILQYYMLEKPIEEYLGRQLRLCLISCGKPSIEKGLLFKACQEKEGRETFTILEAKEKGFNALFELNEKIHTPLNAGEDLSISFIHLQFSSDHRSLSYENRGLFPPLVWSTKEQKIKRKNGHATVIDENDMIFLYNSSLGDYFEEESITEEWFVRVLRHFAEDGIETIQLMLAQELSFLTRKQIGKSDFKIIGFQAI